MESASEGAETVVDGGESEGVGLFGLSPVGLGLLGHKKNETVEIKTPAAVLKYKIIAISR